MRNFAAVAIASMLFASVASAQMKVPQASPQPGSPVVVQAAMQPAAEPSAESARRIPRAEAIKLVKEKKAIFVDVRPKESYDAEHIRGAINIPLTDLMAHIKELPANKLIVTYCA